MRRFWEQTANLHVEFCWKPTKTQPASPRKYHQTTGMNSACDKYVDCIIPLTSHTYPVFMKHMDIEYPKLTVHDALGRVVVAARTAPCAEAMLPLFERRIRYLGIDNDEDIDLVIMYRENSNQISESRPHRTARYALLYMITRLSLISTCTARYRVTVSSQHEPPMKKLSLIDHNGSGYSGVFIPDRSPRDSP